MAHGPLLRRPGHDRQLRQDRARHADGRHAGQHPDASSSAAGRWRPGKTGSRQGRGPGHRSSRASGAYSAGKIDEAALLELEKTGCPTCGSCSGMFTANSMNCLSEALGMALPGQRHHPGRGRAAQGALPGRRAADPDAGGEGPQAARHRHPRERSTTPSVLDMAMGGSTNTVLHTLAIAHEAGIAVRPGPDQPALRPCPVPLQGEPGRAPSRGGRGRGPAGSAPS